MQSALEQFQISINRVRGLIAIYRAMENQAVAAPDPSDILRAALVLSVSALDYYVHEVVRLGMLATHRGQRPGTKAFFAFPISLGGARQQLSADSNFEDFLDNEIRQRNSYKSFQNPDKIAEAIRLVSPKKLWEEVGKIMDRPALEIKRELNIIVERRNKIAHEADIDPTLGLGNRWNIHEADVENAVNFIEALVIAIHTTL